MKKFLVLLVIVFIPCFVVHGQTMAVLDPIATAFLENLHIDQLAHYVQIIKQNVESLAQFGEMLKNFQEQAQRTVQNLASAKDINSWDDFMDFYNRQLYLERKSAETFDKMNVTIGKKQYHITDVVGMAYGFNDTYVDYWDKEFTEEQRREMWLGLGLTPANYAYVQPFRAKARELSQQALTAVPIQNEWYRRNMERNKERQDKLAADKDKPTESKMGSKEITMMILESLMETNKVMNDIAVNQAIEREEQAVKDALKDTPNTTPPLAEWSNGRFNSF